MHYCLGANLARVELQEGLAFLAQHMHGLELDGEPVFESVSGIYGLAELPVKFSLSRAHNLEQFGGGVERRQVRHKVDGVSMAWIVTRPRRPIPRWCLWLLLGVGPV